MSEEQFITRMRAWGWEPVRSKFPASIVKGNIYAWERGGCQVNHNDAYKHWKVTRQLPRGVKGDE